MDAGTSWSGTERRVKFVVRYLPLSCHNLPSSRLLGNRPSAADPSARVSQGDKLLFDPHRLKLRLDGGGEIRILLCSSTDGSSGATVERHNYGPFMVSTYAACRPLGSSSGARLSFRRNGLSRRFNVSCVGL